MFEPSIRVVSLIPLTMRSLSVRTAFAYGLALLALSSCRGATQPVVVIPGATHPAGNLSTKIIGLTGRPFAVRVSSAGVVYATQQDANSVASFNIADATTGPSVAVGADPGDVVFTRNGAKAFVSAFYGGSIHVIDVASGRQTASIPVSSNTYRLVLSSDESTLFVSSTDGRVYTVSTSGERVTGSVQLGSAIQGLALSPSGASLVASSTNGSVWLLDATTLKILASSVPGGHLQDVAFSKDASEIYVAAEDGWVDVLDGSSLQRISRITLDGMAPFGLAVTPDDAQLYVTSPLSGQLAIIDRGTRALKQTIRVSGAPRRVAFNSTGSIAVIANEANWVDLVR
jgi:YVTN family beta-propeller protein